MVGFIGPTLDTFKFVMAALVIVESVLVKLVPVRLVNVPFVPVTLAEDKLAIAPTVFAVIARPSPPPTIVAAVTAVPVRLVISELVLVKLVAVKFRAEAFVAFRATADTLADETLVVALRMVPFKDPVIVPLVAVKFNAEAFVAFKDTADTLAEDTLVIALRVVPSKVPVITPPALGRALFAVVVVLVNTLSLDAMSTPSTVPVTAIFPGTLRFVAVRFNAEAFVAFKLTADTLAEETLVVAATVGAFTAVKTIVDAPKLVTCKVKADAVVAFKATPDILREDTVFALKAPSTNSVDIGRVPSESTY